MNNLQVIGAPSNAQSDDEKDDGKHILTPARTTPAGEFSVRDVQRALDNQLNGDYDASIRLWRAMMTDTKVRSCAMKRCMALVQSPLKFEGNDKDTVAWLEQMYPEILPESPLVQLLLWRLGIGFGFGQLVVDDTVDGFPILRLHVLDPHSMRWNYGMTPGLDDNGVGIPGWSWVDAKKGRIQLTPGEKGVVIIDSRNEGFASGVVAGCGKIWQRKAFCETSLIDYLDNAGWPITHIGGVEEKDRRAVATDFARSRVTKSFATTKDITVSVLSSSPDAKPEGHQAYIEWADRQITIEIEGAHLQAELNGQGSYAAAEVHNGIARRTIMSDAQDVSTQLRSQVFEPNVRINGIAVLAPYPRFVVEPPSDVNATLDTSLKAFELLERAKLSGYRIKNLTDVLLGAVPELETIDQEQSTIEPSNEGDK